MKTRLYFKILLLCVIAILPLSMQALSASHFAASSKLASGKWAKVSIHETGVHEITAAQLAEMGFNDLSKVKVFGHGGSALNEVLNNNLPDDLNQIPVLVANNKVIFYAQGCVEATTNFSSSIPYHTIKVNPYSTRAYYFITDSDAFQPLYTYEAAYEAAASSDNDITTSYTHLIHNREILSLINSGKTFYGEDLIANNNLNFTMPHYIDGAHCSLAFSVAACSSAKTTVSASINGSNIELKSNSLSKLASNKGFEISSPYGTSTTLDAASNYTLNISVDGNTAHLMRLDFFTVTYQRENIFDTDSTQMHLALMGTTSESNVVIKNVTEPITVWNIKNGGPQKQFTITPSNNKISFQPYILDSSSERYKQFIAFKPAQTLKSVTIEGAVENQNLHSAATPDMVIIHPRNFKQQAEKLAQIHHSYDGYDVLAIDEQLIFNEFSSGAKDATAYRLFLKMLYDRDPNKLKYLLLLGCGSYDNRGITGFKSENQLLTYQSNDSQGTVSSYVTDDYFGFLADGSGNSLPTDILSIAVGRIPAMDVDDAEAAIGKLIDYITNNDYAEWKNNILIISDEGDNELHTSQAEGLEQIIRNTKEANGIYINKLYQDWYMSSIIKDNNLNGAENFGRQHLGNLLNEGLLYVSYIGHAGPAVLTYDHRLWTSAKVRSTKYKHLPFFALSACETAKYDDNERSFCEELTLANNGGAIGVLAAARTVYSSQNDRLNKALGELLFTLKSDGSYRTIGDASMEAKKSFGTSYNYNKLSFTLFGDPALRFRFPVDRCRVSHINQSSVANSTVSATPLSTITIKGYVTDNAGNIDKSFNGNATVSVFDKAVHYKDLTSPNTKVVYNSFYPREKLSHSTGKVVNGQYSIAVTLPANCQADGDTCEIRVFAQSNDKRLVSGTNKNLIIKAASKTLADNIAPIIRSIVIDGQNASGYTKASSSPVIQFRATDNMAINTKPNDLQGSMKIIVDNGKISTPSLSNFATATDGGKTVNASVQLHNLSAGRHTLQLEVSDCAGNTTQKKVTFYVIDDALDCTLTSSDETVSHSVEFNIDTQHHIAKSTLFVRDSSENTIITIQNNNGAFTWNLKNANGSRVKPGRYTIFATFEGNEGSGATEPIKIIVLNK